MFTGPEGRMEHLGRRMGIPGAFTNWVMNELQLLNLASQSTLKSGCTSISGAQTGSILLQKP